MVKGKQRWAKLRGNPLFRQQLQERGKMICKNLKLILGYKIFSNNVAKKLDFFVPQIMINFLLGFQFSQRGTTKNKRIRANLNSTFGIRNSLGNLETINKHAKSALLQNPQLQAKFAFCRRTHWHIQYRFTMNLFLTRWSSANSISIST